MKRLSPGLHGVISPPHYADGWRFPAVAPAAMTQVPTIPLDPILYCLTVDLQVIQFDEGASHFVAFTRGLHAVLGQ